MVYILHLQLQRGIQNHVSYHRNVAQFENIFQKQTLPIVAN